jgi:hypothetical protein
MEADVHLITIHRSRLQSFKTFHDLIMHGVRLIAKNLSLVMEDHGGESGSWQRLDECIKGAQGNL